jgi:hypothetical protein
MTNQETRKYPCRQGRLIFTNADTVNSHKSINQAKKANRGNLNPCKR